jgi:hypothetical protein
MVPNTESIQKLMHTQAHWYRRPKAVTLVCVCVGVRERAGDGVGQAT